MSKPIQQQVARLVWHANYSLKRSFSAVTNAAANAMPGPNPNYAGQGSLNKNWIHPPDALIYGRVEYTVKLLGDVPVDQAKGTEVIKGAVQVLRFNLSVKKSTGFKLQKVELHINVDGVNIVDAKTKMVLHKYPLHRISFCADDKNDKRLFAFIARQQSALPNNDIGCSGADGQRHHCYVFLSDKLAEEITLTIGEAFDLAYRRFLDNNGRDLELKKQVIILRKRVNDLEMENAELKRQLAQQERAVANSSNLFGQNSLADILSVSPSPPTGTAQPVQHQSSAVSGTAKKWENFCEFGPQLAPMSKPPPPLPTSPVPQSPPVALMQLPPPSSRKSHQQQRQPGSNVDIMQALSSNGPDVGRRLENLRLTEFEDIFDQEFDPRAGEPADDRKNPFERDGHATNGQSGGMNAIEAPQEPSQEDFEMAISMIDSRLADMRDGFSSGLSFGKDDFHVTDFDPSGNSSPAASVSESNRKTT